MLHLLGGLRFHVCVVALALTIVCSGCNASATTDDAGGDGAIADDASTDGGAPDLAGVPQPVWPMDGHDPQRRAQSSIAGPAAPVTLKWECATQINGYAVPLIDAQGGIFEQFSPPTGIGVLDPATGNVARSNGQAWRNIAIGLDGTIYLESSLTQLSALNPTTLKATWSATMPDDPGFPLAITSNNRIVFMGGNQVVVVSAADGTVGWSKPFAVDLTQHPFVGLAVGTDEAVVAVDGTHCASLDPVDGHTRWNVSAAHMINYAPVVGMDGTIYLVEGDGGAEVYLTALNPSDGGVRWNVDLLTIERSGPPAVAPDGTILMLTTSHYQAFAPDGTPKWSMPVTATNFTTQPTVDANGNSYFLADTGKTIVCMSPAGAPVWSTPVQTALNGAIVVGAGGMLFVNGAFVQHLFAFGS